MRESSIERVVGESNPESEKSSLRFFSERFNDQAAYEKYKDKEREKTPDEVALIDLANELTNGLLRKYGLEDFNIPPKNIHIITRDALPEMQGKGLYDAMRQGVLMGEVKGKSHFLDIVTHELLHFKSYNSAQLVKLDGVEEGITDYRSGIKIGTRDANYFYFSNLNEAVTEEICQRLVRSASEHPLVSEEVKKTRELIGKIKIEKPDEVTYAREVDGGVAHVSLAYPEHRKMLNLLIDKLFERNRETFTDREAVFEVFARSEMTGRLLPLGRLIDGTFGVGTFRKIAESDADIKAQFEIVESL